MNCKEATCLIVKKQEEELTFKEKLNLKLHLLICKFCKLFEIQSNFIDNNISVMQSKKTANFKMDKEKKQSLNEAFNQFTKK